jgi:hypothetical protein
VGRKNPHFAEKLNIRILFRSRCLIKDCFALPQAQLDSTPACHRSEKKRESGNTGA